MELDQYKKLIKLFSTSSIVFTVRGFAHNCLVVPIQGHFLTKLVFIFKVIEFHARGEDKTARQPTISLLLAPFQHVTRSNQLQHTT